MEHSALPLMAMALVTPASAIAAHADAQDATALAARLEAVIDAALAQRRIVGAVVIVSINGEIRYRRAAGYADREAQRPMREDAVFRLASMSKPIVSVAALRLVEQGRLRLDDPVTRWLPEFQPRLPNGDVAVITVQHLLTHTAGLGYGFHEPEDGPYHRAGVSDGMDRVDFDLDENLRRIASVPLAYAPGSAWGYSLATDVLGAVVARAHGSSLPVAVEQLVTGPLRMRDTAFVARDDARLVAQYANAADAPVRISDGMRVALPEGLGHDVRFAPSRALDAEAFASGGAGMVGSADDFLRLLESVRGGGQPLLAPASLPALRRDQVGADAQAQGPGWGFGYGWAVLDDPAIAGTPQAAGTLQWGGVYGHNWFVDPANRISMVALTNTAFEGMSGAFPAELRDAIYDPR